MFSCLVLKASAQSVSPCYCSSSCGKKKGRTKPAVDGCAPGGASAAAACQCWSGACLAGSNVHSSCLQLIARAMYSNPPLTGAHLVANILGDPKMKQRWFVEVRPCCVNDHSCAHPSTPGRLKESHLCRRYTRWEAGAQPPAHQLLNLRCTHACCVCRSRWRHGCCIRVCCYSQALSPLTCR